MDQAWLVSRCLGDEPDCLSNAATPPLSNAATTPLSNAATPYQYGLEEALEVPVTMV